MKIATMVRLSVDGISYCPEGAGTRVDTAVPGDPTVAMLGWDAIARVDVFKRDLMTEDLICMRLEGRDGEGIELDEEDRLWSELTAVLPEHLPGCLAPEAWFTKVAFPAFGTKLRVIYERAARSGLEGV